MNLRFGLNPQLLAEAFPFHMVLDKELRVLQVGRSVQRIAPSLSIGGPLQEAFLLERPVIANEFEAITENRIKLFLLRSLDVEELFLKGQMMLDEDAEHLIFVGAPWLHANTDLKQFGLKLSDFSLHDPAADFLFLFKSNRAALDDTNQLATKLRAEKEWAHVTLDSIGDGVIATDNLGRVNYMNRMAQQMTGLTLDKAEGEPLNRVMQLVDEISSHPRESFFLKALNEKRSVTIPSPSMLLQHGGRELVVEGMLTPIQDAQRGQLGMVVVFHDISDRQHLIQQLEHQATHDHLTNLPNRLLLKDRLEQAIRQARRHQEKVAVLFLDLDRFKTINDSLGHTVGDELLKRVGDRLKGVVRESDGVCRLGGDEFVLLLTELQEQAVAQHVAEKIIGLMKAPFHVSSYALSITASIGISLFPEHAQSPEMLLKHADLAMYHAKERGRNNFQLFDVSMDRKAARRLSIESSLRRALEREELSLHYQPKIDLRCGCVTGFEALLRWDSEDHGMVPPDHFIPIAEDTGLIVPIGRWVIEEANRQIAQWRDMGYRELPVAVNISLIQLTRVDLEHLMVETMRHYHNGASVMELEFTESVLLQDFDTAMEVLNNLKRLGITLTIDDFGIGYSSLNYLHRFPIDVLKVDRSFVRGVTVDSDATAIVQAVVGLSQTLGIRTVAEGCETADQMAYLQQIGCDQAQGYLISRPAPADQIEPFLQPDFAFNSGSS